MKKLRQIEQIATFLSILFFFTFSYNFIKGNDAASCTFGILLGLSLSAIIFIHKIKT